MARFVYFMTRTSQAVHRLVSIRSIGKSPKVVLGIETSCDDTGAAIVDENGKILGEAIHSQKEVHLKTGGIIPSVAQQLHQESIDKVVKEAILSSGISPNCLTAIATTVKPGLALSLGVGLMYSLNLVKQHNKPFIPIHHMEAHALTVRLLHPVEFPFLVLLISGGHCILAVANSVSEFLLLGQSLDEAPGESLDKVARRLSLIKHPECSTMSGGQSIEHVSQFGDKTFCNFTLPMSQHRDCNFSFAGLRNHFNRIIQKMENVEGLKKGEVLSHAADIAASFQHAVAHHIVKRTQRAILYCKQENLFPLNASLVVSGGVASNGYIRKMLENLTNIMDMSLFCPPPNLCTDNGVMIAWNGIERLRVGVGVLNDPCDIRYEPRAPLGRDISDQVKMKVVILAAGYGTRLHQDLQTSTEEKYTSLTGIPKPLLPIGKLPLISYWIEALIARGYTKDIFIVTNDLYYDKFKQWAENYPCVQLINDGTSSNEGRLGAMACLQLVIDKCRIHDHVIIIGGDLLFYEDFHLQNVLEKFETLSKENNEANLVLSYTCKEEETKKYGILETDENQKITALLEKPLSTDTTSRQACPCFYILSKQTLPHVKEFLHEKKHAPIVEKDAPGHFLSWLVTRKPVYSHQISGRFDVGNLESYIECNNYFGVKTLALDYLK